MYNEWFMTFAPQAFRETRIQTTANVESTLQSTANMTAIRSHILRQYPQTLSTLRMATCPPLAVDRLIGLAKVPGNLVRSMELRGRLPRQMPFQEAEDALIKIIAIINKMLDPDIIVWLERPEQPTDVEINRAATIIADRLCGSVANPIVRNAQEKRQLASIRAWLEARGYVQIQPSSGQGFKTMEKGTYGFHMNVPVMLLDRVRTVNIPIDAVIMPKHAGYGDMPILIEAKSAGDFTNTNKRRKEEATKMAQLRATYGDNVRFNLFLCGYFDSGYLGYEAAEGIDWIWEHRIDDLALLGL
jgi:type II restriction enzyme